MSSTARHAAPSTPAVTALLERLTPQERAVFVLREAFSHGYREIAEALELPESTCRLLHRRALRRTGGRRGTAGRPAVPAASAVPAELPVPVVPAPRRAGDESVLTPAAR
ncbi:hypothetical protein GCM10010466_53930 [Planomonospora alba]|uniref:RNA polymerase sigma factor 70 region 4 type 2 domain-containing protein n=1 Tax=Planomonospora alba TaxID=161354 RepID=A0ABP6NST8_9ACTN